MCDDNINLKNNVKIPSVPSEEHIERCKKIISEIDLLSQTEIEEIFKMIHKFNNNIYTKNNNGAFINLTWIPVELLQEIEQYIKFCNQSRYELKKYESICDILNANINDINIQESKKICQTKKEQKIKKEMQKDVKEDENENITEEDVQNSSKISSSLKFALLKKKFSKVATFNTNYENDLKKEDYVIE